MTHQVILDYRTGDLRAFKGTNSDGDVVLDFVTPDGKVTMLMTPERFSKLANVIGTWDAKRELEEALDDDV